jgi:hypothetical protein
LVKVPGNNRPSSSPDPIGPAFYPLEHRVPSEEAVAHEQDAYYKRYQPEPPASIDDVEAMDWRAWAEHAETVEVEVAATTDDFDLDVLKSVPTFNDEIGGAFATTDDSGWATGLDDAAIWDKLVASPSFGRVEGRLLDTGLKTIHFAARKAQAIEGLPPETRRDAWTRLFEALGRSDDLGPAQRSVLAAYWLAELEESDAPWLAEAAKVLVTSVMSPDGRLHASQLPMNPEDALNLSFGSLGLSALADALQGAGPDWQGARRFVLLALAKRRRHFTEAKGTFGVGGGRWRLRSELKGGDLLSTVVSKRLRELRLPPDVSKALDGLTFLFFETWGLGGGLFPSTRGARKDAVVYNDDAFLGLTAHVGHTIGGFSTSAVDQPQPWRDFIVSGQPVIALDPRMVLFDENFVYRPGGPTITVFRAKHKYAFQTDDPPFLTLHHELAHQVFTRFLLALTPTSETFTDVFSTMPRALMEGAADARAVIERLRSASAVATLEEKAPLALEEWFAQLSALYLDGPEGAQWIAERDGSLRTLFERLYGPPPPAPTPYRASETSERD